MATLFFVPGPDRKDYARESRMTLDRRQFLHLTALGIVATVADSACASRDRNAGPIDRPELLGMLGTERVRQLGTHYRAATPSENSAAALRAAVSNQGQLRIPLLGRKSIEDQIREDFADGRTVLIDGWVLSVTEARQAALFSLTPI